MHENHPSMDPPFPPPGAEGALAFDWKDARGRNWRVEIDREKVALSRPDERFEIPRSRWEEDVSIAPTGSRSIVRFSTPERDVGFLLDHPADTLGRLFQKGVFEIAHDRSPVEVPRQTAPPLFPRMAVSSVWALYLAALAFIPVIGIFFAGACVIVLVVTRRTVSARNEHAHVRKMRKITGAWLVLNLAIWGLSSWNVVRVAQAPSALLTATPTDAQYGTYFQRHVLPSGWDYGTIVAVVFVLLFSLSVHEAAHAVTALWQGDDYARSLGRITLNPLAHLDPFGSVILPIILISAGLPAFGYARPVPVIPSRMRHHRRSDIWVSAAGPGSNLLIALACLALYCAIGCALSHLGTAVRVIGYDNPGAPILLDGVAGAQGISALLEFLGLSETVNVFLALFNMLPIPPLDGSHVMGNLYPHTFGRFYEKLGPYAFILFLALIWTGALGRLLGPSLFYFHLACHFLLRCTGLF